jgi:hypothetical protein
MAKGNGNSKGVRGGGSAGTNKVSLRSARPSPLPTEFRFRGLGFGRDSCPGWSNAGETVFAGRIFVGAYWKWEHGKRDEKERKEI